MLRGYSAAAGATLGVTNATLCEANTYRSDDVLYDAAGGIGCVNCPSGMQTQPNVTGATSVSQCLAPPGYGWNATDGTASKCPQGTYNPGWNK